MNDKRIELINEKWLNIMNLCNNALSKLDETYQAMNKLSNAIVLFKEELDDMKEQDLDSYFPYADKGAAYEAYKLYCNENNNDDFLSFIDWLQESRKEYQNLQNLLKKFKGTNSFSEIRF